MEIWEFDRLLRERFIAIRVQHVPKTVADALPYSKLSCTRCGHVCIFSTRYILTWHAEGKSGLMQFLLCHVLCKGTYGT